MSNSPRHDHDLGLQHDLATIASRMVGRRRALALFGAAGASGLLAGCGGGGTASAGNSTTAALLTTPAPATTTTTTATSTTTTTSSGCVALPTETNGPFPADGSNTASGLTSNVLTSSGVVRTDIRSSFVGSSTAIAAGVQLALKIKLANTSATCAPLSGYAVYLWHCDAVGKYSLYDLPNESYLRGVQVSDANGEVSFQTIVPGCYSGRYPHIHFEVYPTLASATTYRNLRLVSQLAIPSAVAGAVYSGSAAYTGSTANFARVTTSSDNVLGDNSAAQIAAMTPALTGDVTAGYAGSVTVGLAV